MLDKDIREPLFDYLDDRYGKVRTIEEKVINRSRADVLAVIPGEILGFEIKSDSDTYTRLRTQIKDYESFCDRCYIVVGEKHIHAEEHVPEYWGIIFVNDENVIVERDAAPCPKVNINNQLNLLWRNELLNVQLKEGLPKLRNVRRLEIYKRLLDTCGLEKLKLDVTEELFERDYTIYDITDRKVVRGASEDSAQNDKTDKSSAGKKSFKTGKKGVRVRRKVRAAGEKADKKRAHVTNYIGKRNKKK